MTKKTALGLSVALTALATGVGGQSVCTISILPDVPDILPL
eukprot:COSAG02_NODE_4115_length_5754_cov_4.144474_1_plen_40_part_10